MLGMKVLRHEEFEKGCEAACNGPYDGKWSKTMIGYGQEDDHFVVELTYNYGIKEYKLGNDFLGIAVTSDSILSKVKELDYTYEQVDNTHFKLSAPDGYKFSIQQNCTEKDPVTMVSLSVSNLKRSLAYWHGLLSMEVYEENEKSATLGYSKDQCALQLVQISDPIDHAEAFGRIAFSCPGKEVKAIEQLMKDNSETILTPYISLDTPGKATVQVVILADPDGHEICFVGDEGFRELSQLDISADQLLNQAIEDDKSDEWFAKKKARQNKVTAS